MLGRRAHARLAHAGHQRAGEYGDRVGLGVAVSVAVGVTVVVGVCTKKESGVEVAGIGNPMVGEGKIYAKPGWGVALSGAAKSTLKRPSANAPINPTIPTRHVRRTNPTTANGSLRDLGNCVWAMGAATGLGALEADICG